MRLSTENNRGRYTKTAFQNFMETYDLLLLTVKVQCPVCGHTWGISVDYSYSTDIPENKFKCMNCSHYCAKGDSISEGNEEERTRLRNLNDFLKRAEELKMANFDRGQE